MSDKDILDKIKKVEVGIRLELAVSLLIDLQEWFHLVETIPYQSIAAEARLVEIRGKINSFLESHVEYLETAREGRTPPVVHIRPATPWSDDVAE